MEYIKLNKINLILIFSTLLLLVLGTYNFLLFHSIIEILSIVVAVLIFLLALNARHTIDNNFIKIVGVSFFFIAVFDMLHAFSYSGLNVFPGENSNLPTQLWLSARLIESLTLLIALFLINYRFKFYRIFNFYLVLSVFLLSSIFYLKIFPVAYIEDQGLTNFKIYTEYFISAVFILSLFLLFRRRRLFNKEVFQYLNYSIAFIILTELVFTLYISVYSAWSMVGHILKLISFYFIYKAVVERSIQAPQEVLFNNLKQSQMRLAESEKKYKDLFSHMNAGFALHRLIKDKNGRTVDYEYMEVNDYFLKITGTERKNLIGRRVTEAFPGIENDPADWINTYSEVATKGKNLVFEQYAEPLKKWYTINAYSPRPGYFATVVTDITEQKQIENELKTYTERLEELTQELYKFQLAVEDASDAILITDPEGKIIYANKATEKITGYTEKEMIGNSSRLWGNLIFGDKKIEQRLNQNIWESLPHKDKKFAGEVINRRKNGEEFYSFLTVAPVLNEKKEVEFLVCLERDISQNKEIDKAKSDFIYFVSHELKTPLASIFLAIDLFIKEGISNLPAEQKEYLLSINKASKEMSEFIDELLNISRIESNTLFLDNEPTDVRIEIKNLLDELKMEIEDKELKVLTNFQSHLPIIEIDNKVFRLIIRNLLTNAIHYTPNQGEIKVSAQENNGYLEVCINDTGCGIPEKEHDKVFNKLYRSSNVVSSKIKGSGLGLYIVKSMVDKIGAKIELDSKEGFGSKFCVKIPLPKD